MRIVIVIASVFLSLFSTSVMSYLAMATPIGPWIAPTLALTLLLVVHLLRLRWTNPELIYAVAAGSIGGILATAAAFSFPTLYFLDPIRFAYWLEHPLIFVSMLSSLSLVAGWCGIWVANIAEEHLLVESNLSYPIGRLVFNMVSTRKNIRKAYELAMGFVGTTFFCILQDGLFSFRGILPKTLRIMPAFAVGPVSIAALQLDLWPMLWAIGFITGHIIAIPLAVGALSQLILLQPLHVFIFQSLSYTEFTLAFCSGIVVCGALDGFWDQLRRMMKNNKESKSTWKHLSQLFLKGKTEGILLAIAMCALLTYFQMPLLEQLFLFVGTAVCTYQIALLAGKIGLALLGRFATFIMLPAMLIFGSNSLHLVSVAMIVQIAGGVASDVLFGRRANELAQGSKRTVRWYQYLGLIISSLAVGVVFWVLIKQFGLGSQQLFAQKAQARRLLIDVRSFNLYAVLIGALFGWILKKLKINETLVFGGLLMPLNFSIGLIVGGMLTYVVKNREEWDPFWSGVFASNSIWMIAKSIL